MSAADLYAMTPIETSHSLWRIRDHLTEFRDDWFGLRDNDEDDKIECRTLADPYIAGDRCHWLATVWFEAKPVMIIQTGGRGGSDHQQRFVTDPGALARMVDYIRATMFEAQPPKDVIDVNTPLRALTTFYGGDVFEAAEADEARRAKEQARRDAAKARHAAKAAE